MRTLVSTLLLTTCASTLANTFGVTGTAGYGTLDPQTIYHITSNGATTKVGKTANVVPNSLAYNPVADVYYYGDHNGSNLYAFDAKNANNVFIADLKDHGMPSNYFLSGGADFYQGTYYYSPEISEVQVGSVVTPQQATDIFAVNFSTDGLNIISHSTLNLTLPAGWSSLGDYGDIAVDTSSGVLYGSSRAVKGTASDGAYFWSVDLNDASKTIKVIGKTAVPRDKVYQIAYDSIENAIFGNEWQSDKYVVISEADGSVVSTKNIGGNFYDLASSARPDVVPEPSSTLLLGIASLSLALRRTR